jgi:two-component system cell cycle response regulator DivK
MKMEARGKYDFDFSGKSVLVVEDTMMSFKLISTVLNQVHATVTHASNGYKAIELCGGDQHFDVVVMDIQMPGMNGIEATKEIKKLRPALPVIATTANTFDSEEKACREAGCDSFVTKPLQFKQLFELMQQHFDRQT